MNECGKNTDQKCETELFLADMQPAVKKAATVFQILKTMHGKDPDYFASISDILSVKGAEQSMDAAMSLLTSGRVNSVKEYDDLKKIEKDTGTSMTKSIDLLLNFSFDKLIADLNSYNRPDWFDSVKGTAMWGYIRGIKAGAIAEQMSNDLTSKLNLQTDVDVLFRQCPVIDKTRTAWHKLSDYILGRTDDFNKRYQNLVDFVVNEFGKEGVAIVNKYMKYMDNVHAEYAANGTGGIFDQLMVMLSNDPLVNKKNKKIKTPDQALKALTSTRDKFWSEFNYGTEKNPNFDHFRNIQTIDQAEGSFAKYHKEIGQQMADILLEGLETYGLAPSDVSDIHWGILTRFADEARLKPFLDVINKDREDNGQKPLQMKEYSLRKGYIPTKGEQDDSFGGLFEEYGNIRSFKEGHAADGDFLTGLAERIQQLKFAPTAMAEELTLKYMDNIVNSNKTKVHTDYLAWRNNRQSVADKLERHIEKVYSIMAYHKDSIADKAFNAVQEYRNTIPGLVNSFTTLAASLSPENRSKIDSAVASIAGELMKVTAYDKNRDSAASANTAKDIEKTVRRANNLVNRLENIYNAAKDLSPIKDEEFHKEMETKFYQLKSIEHQAADFDYNSFDVTLSRLQSIRSIFEKINNPDTRLELVQGMNAVINSITGIRKRISDAPSVFERKALYAEARRIADDSMAYVRYMDQKYGKFNDQVEGEIQRYIRRTEYCLKNIYDVTKRVKNSTEYLKHTTFSPDTWISTKSMTMYTSLMMTCMLKNSALSNLLGAATSAASLSPAGKQAALIKQYIGNRKTNTVLGRLITEGVEQYSTRIMGAIKEAEVYDVTAHTKNANVFSKEYWSGAPSAALDSLIRNNMESGWLAGVRSAFNVFGKDPRILKCEGWMGLFTMSGSEKSVFIRGFAKTLLDDAIRTKVAILEASGKEVLPEDIPDIVSDVVNKHGEAIRKYMDITRGRFTKDNKSPWGWGAADMARTRPDIFKGMLLTTMLAFKQPMAYASNALAKSTFRALFSYGSSWKDGVPIASPLVGAALLAARYWFQNEADDDEWWEKSLKSPFFSAASEGFLPSSAFEADYSLLRLAAGMAAGIPTSFEDYEMATNHIARIPGPVWDGLWKIVIDDIFAEDATDGEGFFVDMTVQQYASFVKKRVGLLNVDKETSNLLESMLLHLNNAGRVVRNDIEQYVDVPMYMADAVVGFNGRPYGEYAKRQEGFREAVTTKIPFFGPIFGKTNDHVSGMLRMLNYFDLAFSQPGSTYASGKKWDRFWATTPDMLYGPFGLNGFIPLARDLDTKAFQVRTVNEAIRNNQYLDPVQQTEYSQDFIDHVSDLYRYNKQKRDYDELEESEEDSE